MINTRETPTNPTRQRGNRSGVRGGRPSLTRRVSTDRTGTIYIAVLGVAMIVGVIGAAAIHVARIELHDAVTADEMARAKLAAQSGIEYAISVINNNADWRTEYESGTPVTLADARSTLTGTGTFSFTLTDSDGDLEDDDQDSVTLRSVGTTGDASSVMQVLLLPAGMGLDCLGSALHSQGTLTVSSTLTSDPSRVSSNSNINANTGTIDGRAASTGTITGGIPEEDKEILAIPLEIPDPESVFEYYKANGTWIPVDSLTSGNRIGGVLLSPDSNPYGTSETNPQGIYVIDCQGRSITLRDCWIVGTLVLLDAGPGTLVKDKIVIEPAIPNFPALMVEGPLEMDWDYRNGLDVGNLLGSINLSGNPLEAIIGGLVNGLMPSKLKGLVYLTEGLRVKNQWTKIDGVVIVEGTASIESRLILNYDSTYLNNPPPGFASGSKMKIVPGTWKRAALP